MKCTLGMGLASREKKRGKGFKQVEKRREKKGQGLKSRTLRKKRARGLTFNSLVKKAHKAVKNKSNKIDSLGKAIQVAVGALKGAKNITRVPRVIPIPKSGGALALLPILSTISALGLSLIHISEPTRPY